MNNLFQRDKKKNPLNELLAIFFMCFNTLISLSQMKYLFSVCLKNKSLCMLKSNLSSFYFKMKEIDEYDCKDEKGTKKSITVFTFLQRLVVLL